MNEYQKEKKEYIAQFMKMGIPREQAAKKAEWQLAMNKKIELVKGVAEYDHERLWYIIKLMEQTGSSLEDALDWLRDIELGENEDCWNIESLKKDYQDALSKVEDDKWSKRKEKILSLPKKKEQIEKAKRILEELDEF